VAVFERGPAIVQREDLGDDRAQAALVDRGRDAGQILM
jgi:hypothetical protein